MNQFQSDCLFAYTILQAIFLLIIVCESDLKRTVVDNFIVAPYKKGITIGNVFSFLFWLPAMIVGTISVFLITVTVYIFSLQVTRQKDNK